MSAYLRIDVRFLQSVCHGRGEDGSPEWPPSPLRMFQALVAAAAGRWNERTRLETAVPALRWLERQPSPEIVAPVGAESPIPYRLYVPDNVADKVAAAWCRGTDADIAGFRTEKDVRPLHLAGDLVHYLYALRDSDEEFDEHRETILAAARSLTHLGWGWDMVVGNATLCSQAEASQLAGERWVAARERGPTPLRIPGEGTLEGLVRRHSAFLGRIPLDDRGTASFAPVPPLSGFRIAHYRRVFDPERRAFAAFSLLSPNGRGPRAFDTARRGMAVAGMVRGAAANAAARGHWDELDVARFVLGHGESRGDAHRAVDGPRLAYVPLPSVQPRGNRGTVVGDVRRIMLMTYGETGERNLQRMARLLGGAELVPESHERPQDSHTATALLSPIPNDDSVVRRYTTTATTWATVTPMVLPGYDDPRHLRRRLERDEVGADERRRLLVKLHDRIDGLIRKAIEQAGYSSQLAESAEIEWRSTGFWPGTELASRYATPVKLRRFPRYHVRITWRDPQGGAVRMRGPLCLGGGRFYGLGLFAALD